MKSKISAKKINFEEDYKKIVKNAPALFYSFVTPQWNNPGDFIVKFSLYQESPNSIASTNTLVTANF
jgi:hypothetical protein